MNSGSNGGGGATQTASKEPWAPAVPWITSNLQRGQELQNQYQASPFNAIQQGAYSGLLGGNDYINQMTPGLLSQMSQSQGFDRNNPRARPQAYQFPAMQQMQQMQPLLASTFSPPTAMSAAPAPAAAAPGTVTGLFGTVPAPAPIPGLTSPAPLPTTWPEWLAGLSTAGSN
jgi:hypothetical protein